MRCARAVVLVTLVAGGCKLESEALAPDSGSDPADAMARDAAIDAHADLGCEPFDSDVVFYLTMNRPSVTIWPDLTGDHEARTAPGTTGTADPPRPECGRAYPASGGITLTIEDSADFDLAVGAVDIYAQVPPPGVERGILSRDASLQALPGHFDLRFDDTNKVVARIQSAAGNGYRCSAAQTEGEWVHIGVNWGPPDLELYVDGALALETAANHLGVARTCNDVVFTDGIDGNDNPWLISHSAAASEEGAATPPQNPLGTAVDELRLSRVRRAY